MKKLSKYYSKKAAFLKCPHCMAETHVGHFAWSALVCLSCGAMVNKEDWFLSDWQDAEQSVHPTESGGWVCSKCKTINSQEWSDCCFCDTPRIGG